MSESRLFWKSYFRQSLGVSWWVGPQKETQFKGPGEAVPVISEPYLFVTTGVSKDPSLKQMMERMIVAIGQGPETVFCLSSEDPEYTKQALQSLEPSQKVMFFGAAPVKQKAAMGEWFSLGKAQAIQTHELMDLKVNPKLKKQTWAHLQAFVGIRA